MCGLAVRGHFRPFGLQLGQLRRVIHRRLARCCRRRLREEHVADYTLLSAKALENKIILVDDLSLPFPKTKEFLKVAAALGLRDALIVIDGEPENLALGVRNLKAFKTLPAKALNVYDILSYDQLVLTGAALEKITEVLAK